VTITWHSQQRENAWHVHSTLSPAKSFATEFTEIRLTTKKYNVKKRISRLTTHSWWGWFDRAVTSHKHSEASSQNNV